METKLNMPKTNFTERSNWTTREPQFLQLWATVLNDRNKLNNKEYTLHDGPPYANGDVHLGHVLNKLLKDFFVKYHLMNGYKVNFRPGSDCHGLPTELAVQKKYGKMDKVELREKCGEWAKMYSEKQQETFKLLGVFAQWENPYKTMDKDYEVSQLNLLYHFLKNNFLYVENRPTYYSPSTQTVLAEAELEYKDKTDNSVYFKLMTNKNYNLLVWTTQPYTLFSNAACGYNKNVQYVKVLHNEEYYVLSKSAQETLFPNEKYENDFKFENDTLYHNPLTNEYKKLLETSFVKENTGTGLLHLSPAHGEDDFDVCSKHGLSSPDLTDTNGKLSNGFFCLNEGNEDALNQMKEKNMVLRSEKVTHSYPHDWRTGKPVYFKLTEQVFLDLKNLKQKATKALNEVVFMDNNKKRFESMLQSRDRWCLSRQRKWGFPLAVFFDENKKLFYSEELQTHLTNLFQKHGSNCWFSMSENELLPQELRNKGLTKCEFTMDVWFDSGSSWFNVLQKNKQADLYLEGNDQHRGWFQSSLLLSSGFNNHAPFKSLLSHGFVLDESGKKMSKSLGNVVELKSLQSKYNTDLVRLWVASSNYLEDVTMSDNVMKNCSEVYFKFRNTLKYLLGNLYNFDPNFKFEMGEKENAAMALVQEMNTKCHNFYPTGNFKKVLETLVFSLNVFSSKYLDVETKSYLYEYELESMERRRCQYVLNHYFNNFVRLLAPLCPFLAEDAYQQYEFKENYSLFMENFM